MTKRTALPLVIAFTALGCGAENDDSDNFLPAYGGTTPNSASTPGASQNPSNPAAPGVTSAPGVSGGQGRVNEGAANPGLAATAPAGATNGSSVATTPSAMGPGATPASEGSPAMLDLTIEAETLNQAASNGFGLEPGGTAVGGFEVGSAICFDNVNLTGIQSIDVQYARNQADVSSFGRFAILWGGKDVKTAMNLGEKLTTGTGGWSTFQPINVGLAQQVSGVGQLCFRGLQGNGILNMDSFTLRGTAGTNDGVTNFNIAKPQGPAVPLPQVRNAHVEFGGPGTSVAGNSFFWSNGQYGNDTFYTAETVKWLKENWGSRIVRAALAVNDQDASKKIGGYLDAPFDNQFNVQKVVNAAIENGMYAIIDFHAHHAEDVRNQAVQFFTEMATFYGSYPNVIYEVYNEPLTDWNTIKAYAQPVIAAIRAVDKDNLIIVGTPNYSSDLAAVANDTNNPFKSDPNIAYTLHFYAGEGAHNAYQQRATAAMAAGLAVFVTEWGTTGANGLTAPNEASTTSWMNFLRTNSISHCNWVVGDQGEATASQLLRGASPTGGWTDAQLSSSGKLVKGIISGWPKVPGL